MTTITNEIAAFHTTRRGASMIEYGLLVGLIAGAAILGVATSGTKIACIIQDAANALPAVSVSTGCGSGGQAANSTTASGQTAPSTPDVCASNTDSSTAYFSAVRNACNFAQIEPGSVSNAKAKYQTAVAAVASMSSYDVWNNGIANAAAGSASSAYQNWAYMQCGTPDQAKADPSDYNACLTSTGTSNMSAIFSAGSEAQNAAVCQSAPGGTDCANLESMDQAADLLGLIQ